MPQTPRTRKLIYALGAIVGLGCGVGLVLHAVFTSTNSTAAIGLLLVPVYGLFGAGVGWAVLYVGFTFFDVAAGRRPWRSQPVLAASGLLTAALLFGGALLLLHNAMAVAEDPQAGPDALLEVSTRWIPLWKQDVSVALAKNPATPESVLAAMVDDGRDDHLVSLVGANPNTPLPVLEKIIAGPLSYSRVAGVAGHPRLTAAMAQRLASISPGDFPMDVEYSLYQTYVLAALVENPATPQAIFDALAVREAPEYFLSVAVIYAARSTCAQVERAGAGGNEVLKNTAQSVLKRRGC